jgi:hypothetical protein
VVVIVASIVDDRLSVEIFILFIFSIITILLAVRITRSEQRVFSARLFVLLLILIGVSIFCDGLAYLFELTPDLKTLFFVSASLIRCYIFGYGWFSLVKTLAAKQKVTDNTIITAIIGYLFIGILYSIVYFVIWHVDPKAFHFSVTRYYDIKPWNLAMYFSLMTLTTVGYGDIIPVNKWLMALAMFEAMTGAIYLTIIVARLVSLYSSPD